MCAQSSNRDTFDRLASEYDELKLRVIPGYRHVQDLALRYASANPRQRVLELGCGTGEWASVFFRNHPEVDYVAVEFSPNMRRLASTRLSTHRKRLQLLDQDLNASLPEGPFDPIVSFFAIHHVQNKQRLVQNVFASLAPGGLFLYADITIASDSVLERSFLDGWAAFMHGAAKNLPSSTPPNRSSVTAERVTARDLRAGMSEIHTTATFTLWIGGSESNRQSHFSPPSLPIQSWPVVVPK